MPIAGLSGFGGGASASVFTGGGVVWTAGSAHDQGWIDNLKNSPYNYDTSGNGGVDVASVNGNNCSALTHQNNTGGWSMAISGNPLATDRPMNILLHMSSNYTSSSWFGLGLKLANNTAFNTVIRSQSGQQGVFWQVNGGSTNNTDSAVSSVSNLTETVALNTVCKMVINPLDTEQNGVAGGKIAVYIGGTLDQTVTMTSDFITHIENGEVYAITDTYNTGTWTLQRQTYS
tara:strand:+ start:3879 stop:4571 length:693 start_codon:yes stop_codon:yes gene_type:complete